MCPIWKAQMILMANQMASVVATHLLMPTTTDVTQDGVKTFLSGYPYRTEINNSNMQILDSTTDRLMDLADSVQMMPAASTVPSLDQRVERRKNVISESEATLSKIKSKILNRTHGKFSIKEKSQSGQQLSLL